jgi:hypothetical protein
MVAMRMNPVRLLEMLQRLNSAGLKLTELTSIGKGCPPYSFNATFTSAARPVRMAETRTTGPSWHSTVPSPLLRASHSD